MYKSEKRRPIHARFTFLNYLPEKKERKGAETGEPVNNGPSKPTNHFHLRSEMACTIPVK